jgi:spore coat polysaccharide biosynthesis protein SpsF (cytidylyltransferase family)
VYTPTDATWYSETRTLYSAPVLCIIQARLASMRLKEKMLQHLNGEMLIERAWRMASEMFDNVVVAVPHEDGEGPLAAELARINADVFVDKDRDPADVLGRLYRCAFERVWRPDCLIVRWTPDDPWKDAECIHRALNGERPPVEWGCEAFTFEMLTRAHDRTLTHDPLNRKPREHVTYALWHREAPKPNEPGLWTIDTYDDLMEAQRMIDRGERPA